MGICSAWESQHVGGTARRSGIAIPISNLIALTFYQFLLISISKLLNMVINKFDIASYRVASARLKRKLIEKKAAFLSLYSPRMTRKTRESNGWEEYAPTKFLSKCQDDTAL